MANLAKLEFVVLDVSGNNYLLWVLDAELHLSVNGLKDTIDPEKIPTVEQNAKAITFLRYHIHEDLKSEYLTIKNPLTLWNNLKDRFDHQKLVHLPSARYDWINLMLQDFKSVVEYNFALFKISSKLILCGENITDAEMIEKTLSTFHPNTMILAQQYREWNFQKYGELISLLLVAEKNNELLLKNHQIRPTGSVQLPEVHNMSFLKNERGKEHRGERGYRRNRGRGNFCGRFRNQYHSGHLKWQRDGYNSGHQKWQREVPNKRKVPQEGENRGICQRYRSEGHWQRTCRTPKHLVDLYESSKRNNGKRVKTNFANYNLVNESINKASNEIDTAELIGDSKPHQKCGRPIGAKEIVPQKWKLIGIAPELAKVSENTPEVVLPPEEVQTPEVAVTKLPDVGLPPEENVAPEVAHAPEVANASI
ncbi:uncharacterized protein LOC141695906 [Apium graveolens]|uniref:uncharacterized protein LOC141695906 n=1 Tax=Apium graveolens TaxID=4045 RepID=UPI003D7BBDC8